MLCLMFGIDGTFTFLGENGADRIGSFIRRM
jgi:hypothetical protein